MEIKNNFLINNLEEKNFNLNEQYENKKEAIWAEDMQYVAEKALTSISEDFIELKKLINCISNGKWLSRFYSRIFDRKMTLIPHPEYVTEIVRDSNTGDYLNKSGKFLSDFDVNAARDGLHIFGEVRFDHHNDRAIDFVIINKKNSFLKKYAIEIQTNKGHLLPMEKHRDCILGRYINLRTDYTYLEYSSVEIFNDSNISSIDELVDDLEFGYNSLNYL